MRGSGRGSRKTEMDGVKSLAIKGCSQRERHVTEAQMRSERGFATVIS